MSKTGALGYLLGGLSAFAAIGTWAVWSEPEKRVPWVRLALNLLAAGKGVECRLEAVEAVEGRQPASKFCAAEGAARQTSPSLMVRAGGEGGGGPPGGVQVQHPGVTGSMRAAAQVVGAEGRGSVLEMSPSNTPNPPC